MPQTGNTNVYSSSHVSLSKDSKTWTNSVSNEVPSANPPKFRPHQNDLVIVRTGAMRTNMKVFSAEDDRNPLYSIKISGLFSDNTKVEILNGIDKSSHALGTCHFNKFRTSQINFRSFDAHPSKMVWVGDRGSYCWSYSPHQHDVRTQEEQHFIWRRGERTPTSDSCGRLNLELCDADKFEVYAVYAGAAPGASKDSTLQFKRKLDGQWEIMVILTLSALVEKERQKRGRQGNFSVGMLAY
ncbi:hypothetical protein N7447_001924 [Penicillium robsamsonii]|uniref:uncharacterized protein n=1 Tax=Penicillium robsamsonii TaxID=1792511 RepID=UPI00254959ED|nr:uncharacterized protein N7447_001924 [Penicillium robsamsonii]KAJ5835898.1 hypothetical protein N7447_001924 [Penicillium robsamsonii]